MVRRVVGDREGDGGRMLQGGRKRKRWHEAPPELARRFAKEEAERKRRIERDMDVDEGTELAWLLAREADGAAAARPDPRGQARASDSRKREVREEAREWERRVKGRPMASRQLVAARIL